MEMPVLDQTSIDKSARYLLWANQNYIRFLKSDRKFDFFDKTRTYSLVTNPDNYTDSEIYASLDEIFRAAGFSDFDTFGLVTGSGELLQNSAKHVYGMNKYSDEGELNYIHIDVNETPHYIEISSATKYCPLDMRKVKDAMKAGREASYKENWRGFALMEYFFDACYVNHTDFPIKNLRPYTEIALIKLKSYPDDSSALDNSAAKLYK